MSDQVRLTEALLDELASQWRAHDAPIVERLEPGLSESTMSVLMKPIGLQLPREAAAWWQWHDGAHHAFIATSGGKAFSPLAHCVARAAEMRAIARNVSAPYDLSDPAAEDMAHDVWNWDWLPLAEDGAGGMLLIDAGAGTPDQGICPVRYRGPDDGSNATVVAPSIGTLVRRWITALEVAAGPYDHQANRWPLDTDRLPTGFDDRIL